MYSRLRLIELYFGLRQKWLAPLSEVNYIISVALLTDELLFINRSLLCV